MESDLFGESDEEFVQQEIPGLIYLPKKLSQETCHEILSRIANENWFSPPARNQHMRFGPIPSWLASLERIGQSVFSDVVNPR